MINDPIKMRSFEEAAKNHGFHTERVHDRDIGITIVFLGPHKLKKNILRQYQAKDFTTCHGLYMTCHTKYLNYNG